MVGSGKLFSVGQPPQVHVRLVLRMGFALLPARRRCLPTFFMAAHSCTRLHIRAALSVHICWVVQIFVGARN